MTYKQIKLKELLAQAQIDFSQAFVHGVLTIYACKNKDDKGWTVLLQNKLATSLKQKQMVKSLANVQKNIFNQLSDNECSFNLPLADTDSIKNQALSIREWASGFWLGLEHSNLANDITDKDSLEFVRDLQRISSMPLPTEENKHNLADLSEIHEYCRIGIMSFFLSVNKNK